MALVLLKGNVVSTKSLCNAVGIVINSKRGGYWNFRYKPRPYPKTTEEHNASAKRYGMTPLEYTPLPENFCVGDYPQLPVIGGDSKSATYPYDCPELKRNFNEPMHYYTEIAGEDRVDMSAKFRFHILWQYFSFIAVVGGFAALMYVLEDYKFGRPVAAKQYPQDGPHYYFC